MHRGGRAMHRQAAPGLRFSSRWQPEQGGHPGRVEHGRHVLVRRAPLESASRVQHPRQQPQVADRVEEHRQPHRPVNRPVDVGLRLERLVPGGVCPIGGGPRPARDGFDDLDGDVAISADVEHLLEDLPVALVLGHEEVVRQQHGVEVEAGKASLVHGGDRPAVAGHADEADESLGASFHGGLQRAARTHGLVPVVGVAERVKLDQVDAVDAKPLERAMDVLARLAPPARARLGGQEEVLPVAGHPRSDAQLGVTVASGRVDVVDAELEQHVEGAVGLGLAGAGQGGPAEQRHAAHVPGTPERSSLDHDASFPVPRSFTPVHCSYSAVMPAMSSSPNPCAWAVSYTWRTVEATGIGISRRAARVSASAMSLRDNAMLKCGVKSPARTRGKRLRKWNERPPLVDRMSNRRWGSSPALTPSTIASAATATLPMDITLLTSFTACPEPSGPTWWIWLPRDMSRGRQRSSTAASPPTMKTSRPLPASTGPALTGASRQSTPRACAAVATSRQVSGSIVLTSISVMPGRTPPSTPSSPR